jgi:hypothetical protein
MDELVVFVSWVVAVPWTTVVVSLEMERLAMVILADF